MTGWVVKTQENLPNEICDQISVFRDDDHDNLNFCDFVFDVRGLGGRGRVYSGTTRILNAPGALYFLTGSDVLFCLRMWSFLVQGFRSPFVQQEKV